MIKPAAPKGVVKFSIWFPDRAAMAGWIEKFSSLCTIVGPSAPQPTRGVMLDVEVNGDGAAALRGAFGP